MTLSLFLSLSQQIVSKFRLKLKRKFYSLFFTIEINLHNLFLSQCSITYTPLRMLGNQKFSDVCRDIEMEQWFILGQTCFMIHDIHDHIMETYIQIWWL